MGTTRQAIALGLRLGLAHHPLCTEFQTDFVPVGRLQVCSGCLATWPAFFATLPLALAWRLDGAAPLAMLAAGFAMGIPQLASYGWRGSRLQRAGVKALGGVGLAGVVVGAFTAGWPLWGLAAVLAVGLVACIALQWVRMRSILATCDACPFHRDWDSCPGFNAGVAATRRDGEGGPDLPRSLLPP
jgi:hypothetical protein